MPTPSGFKLGFALPQAFPDGQIDMPLIGRVAAQAEALGFDDLWTMDQIVGRIAVLEPLTFLAYIAARTERVRLGVSVIVVNIRNPVQLAKAVSSVDHLSNGRLDLGIGLGATTRIYPAFGMPEEGRVGRFLEGLRVMKALWTQPTADLEGRYWQLQRTSMEPKPVQQPYPPLWFGAHRPDAMTRAARHGDAWMCAGSTPLDEVFGEIERMKATLEREGRDPSAFPMSKRLYCAIDSDEERGKRRMAEWLNLQYGNPSEGERWAVVGSKERVLDLLGRLRDAGLTHTLLNPVFDHEEHLDVIAKEIAPKL